MNNNNLSTGNVNTDYYHLSSNSNNNGSTGNVNIDYNDMDVGNSVNMGNMNSVKND